MAFDYMLDLLTEITNKLLMDCKNVLEDLEKGHNPEYYRGRYITLSLFLERLGCRGDFAQSMVQLKELIERLKIYRERSVEMGKIAKPISIQDPHEALYFVRKEYESRHRYYIELDGKIHSLDALSDKDLILLKEKLEHKIEMENLLDFTKYPML